MRTKSRTVECLVVALLFVLIALATPPLVSSVVVAYGQHQPIVIHGNGAFNAANGVTGGDGTPSKPYVIEGWEIDSGLQDGIRIEQTDAYFVIRNVLVQSGVPNIDSGAGVHFVDVTNGRIENSTVRDNYQGFLLTNATNANIANSTLFGNGFGVTVINSVNVSVTRNVISSTYEDGINTYNATGITITTNTISNQHRGIVLEDSTKLRISSNDVSLSTHPVFDCACPGLYLETLRDVEVSNNTIHSNNNGILQGYVVSNITMVDNTIAGNSNYGMGSDAENATILRNNVSWNGGNGISVGSPNGKILDNYVAFNGGDGLLIVGSGDLVAGNVISGNGRYGIELFKATDATLHANTLTENGIYVASDFAPEPTLSDYTSHTITPDNLVNGLPIYYHKNCDGVTVDGIPIGELIVANCTGVRVSNVTMRPMEIGFEMVFVRDVLISGNSIAGSRWEGIQVLEADNVTVAGNEISSNYFAGIEVWYATHVVTLGNYISRNGFGALVGGTELSVISNDFSENDFGLQTGGTNVTIEGNNFSRNGGGIFACCTSVRVVRNNISLTYFTSALLLEGTEGRVYHNNMIENKFQGGPSSAYRYSFDDGYPSGGNYWSDYEGIDYCHGPNQNRCPGPDGIGDTPYAFPGGGADRYPLMNPYGSEDWAPGASFTMSSSVGTTASVFKVDASSSWDREDPVTSLMVRWDWDSDGVWDTGWLLNKTAEHQYAIPGTYTVLLAVRDTTGLSSETTKKITVVAPLGFSVGATPPEGFAPLSVYLLANFTGGLAPYSYNWTLGDGGASSSSDVTHVFVGPGTYTASLTVVDALGMRTTESTTVIVKEAFGLQISADRPTGFAPLAVSFTASSSGGTAPLSFRWNFGDGGASTSQNSSHTFHSPGVFTIILTAIDARGHAVARTIQINALAPTGVGGSGPVLLGVAILIVFGFAGVVGLVVWRSRRGRHTNGGRSPKTIDGR